MRMILIGAPGSGKGTQARVVSGRLGIPAISTGDIFRQHASDGTSLGVQATTYMNAGEYVPDEVTNGMVKNRLSMRDARKGFILDGYPRTAAQVEELDKMLAANEYRLDHAVLLHIEPDAAVERLLERSVLENREDDTEGVIRHRLSVYSEATAPLVNTYEARGLLVTIDGMGSPDEVAQRLMDALPTPQTADTNERTAVLLTSASAGGTASPRKGSDDASARGQHAHNSRSEEAL